MLVTANRPKQQQKQCVDYSRSECVYRQAYKVNLVVFILQVQLYF